MNRFTSYPYFIQGVLIVILIVIAAVIATYLYIIAIRFKGYLDKRRRRRYESRFQDLLIYEVVANEGSSIMPSDATVYKFRDLDLDRRAVRRILIENIRHFRLQFSGKTAAALRELYIALNLQADALANLRSSNSNSVIMAIKELMEMNIFEARIGSDLFLKNENRYIREISRKYLIVMEDGGIAKVFDSITEPISGIEQLELFQVITEMEIMQTPNFGNWLNENTPSSLVSLCLKLIVYFQQYRNTSDIMQLLGTEDEKLKMEVINALGKLLQVESESSLIGIYDDQNTEGRIEIIKALGRIGSGNRLSFLKYVFDNEKDIELKKYAAKSIVNHNAMGSFLFNNMYIKASPQNRTILAHASNQTIKY